MVGKITEKSALLKIIARGDPYESLCSVPRYAAAFILLSGLCYLSCIPRVFIALRNYLADTLNRDQLTKRLRFLREDRARELEDFDNSIAALEARLQVVEGGESDIPTPVAKKMVMALNEKEEAKKEDVKMKEREKKDEEKKEDKKKEEKEDKKKDHKKGKEKDKKEEKVWVRVKVGKYVCDAHLNKRVALRYKGSILENGAAWCLMMLNWLGENDVDDDEDGDNNGIIHECFHDLLCDKHECKPDGELNECDNYCSADASEELENAFEDYIEFREVNADTPKCTISFFGAATQALSDSPTLGDYIANYCTAGKKVDMGYQCVDEDDDEEDGDHDHDSDDDDAN